MATSVFKAGNSALITGGASGIGLALAKKCHNYGMRVAIVDINKDNLEKAKTSIGEQTSTFVVDVSKIDEWSELKKSVEKDFGRIDLLALNAGVGGKGSWTDTAYFHKIIDTNLFGVINGISTFLPSIQASASASDPAAIVITGSKQGITNPPGNPAYNASKSAVKSIAEHLSYDLRAKDGEEKAPINVHFLVPGWTFTGLTGGGNTTTKPDEAWAPEQVVDYLEKKMAEEQFWVICPDNEVTEEMDKKRMLWTAGDAVEGRPPLTRWRPEWKEKAADWMAKTKV
ncbi:unnamed protein product [Calypogeia fissa]